MSKKVVTLLKMILVSIGLIAIATIADRKNSNDAGSEYDAENTEYYFAMGTTISVSVYTGRDSVDDTAIREKIVDEIENLDQKLLSWRNAESELGRVNNNTDGRNRISTELYVVLKQSLDICEDSQGALDITIRPLAALWNIEGDSDKEFVPPTVQEIEEALQKVDYNNIELISEQYGESSNSTEADYYVYKKSDDIIIDLGATGKGYALDKAKTVLDEEQASGGLITVGGSVLVYGKKNNKDSWKIGVRDPLKPDDTGAMIGYLEFEPGTITCVSTSGGYEKFKSYEGKEYHHILDSQTGYPADGGLLSVTVVCENGLVSDGLSTACFVLGYEKSLPLLQKYDAQAIFMDLNGNIIVTEELKDNWVE